MTRSVLPRVGDKRLLLGGEMRRENIAEVDISHKKDIRAESGRKDETPMRDAPSDPLGAALNAVSICLWTAT